MFTNNAHREYLPQSLVDEDRTGDTSFLLATVLPLSIKLPTSHADGELFPEGVTFITRTHDFAPSTSVLILLKIPNPEPTSKTPELPFLWNLLAAIEMIFLPADVASLKVWLVSVVKE